MKATHQFTNDRGHTYYGQLLKDYGNGLQLFLPLCCDGKTWMLIPVEASGVMLIQK